MDLGFRITWRDGHDWLGNMGGQDWDDLPIPRRWHRCRAQTFGCMDGLYAERCPCGAIWTTETGWTDRNSRRKAEKKRRTDA